MTGCVELKKTKKREKRNRPSQFAWIIKITLFAVATSAVFTLISQKTIESSGYLVAVSLLIVFIGLGVLFDIVGVAVAAANEAPFHAMASHRARGAREAIWLIRHADRVSSVCNDVVGDISGIVSGTVAAFVAVELTVGITRGRLISKIVVSGVVTGATIAGKALGKGIAIRNTNAVLLRVGKLMSVLRRRGGKG